MIRTWEEVQMQLAFADTPAQKLQMILDDIWDENGIDKNDLRLNIFSGTVTYRNGYYFVTGIESLSGKSIPQNPYGGTLEAFLGNKSSFEKGQQVVFTVGLGCLKKKHELITVNRIKSYVELGILSEAMTIDRIIETGFSKQFKQQLLSYQHTQRWPEEFQEFLEQRNTVESLRTEADSIRQQITDAQAERDNVIKAAEQKKNEADASAREAELAAQERKKTADATVASLQSDIDSAEARKRQAETEAQSAEKQLRALQARIDAFRHRYETLFPLNTDELKYLDSATLDINDSDSLQSIISRLEYSYDRNHIITFLMALSTSQVIALCGAPGTGKTTFARQMADALGAKFHLIEVQNNWTDCSDILGFYNPTKSTYQSTAFLDALIEARDEEEYCLKHNLDSRLHIICLDEMNLARVEYYFATFLSLLQQKPEERTLSILPWESRNRANRDDTAPDVDDRLLRYQNLYMPSNLRFVGTMNMDDTAQNLSPKVIDRCIFIEFSESAVAEENPAYSLTDAYFPEICFSEIWVPSVVQEIDQELSRLSADSKKGEFGFIAGPRLRKYAKCMWPLYHLLAPEGSTNTYIDLLLCRKILPSIRSVSQVPKIIEEFPMASERFKDGQARGKQLHPYDVESWSYWE